MAEPTSAEVPFDGLAYIKASNEADALRKAGKQPAPVVKATELVAAPLKEEGDEALTRDGQHLASKSQRRQLTLAQKEASEERGKRLALEGLIEKGIIKPAEAAKLEVAPATEVEPKREGYPSDAEFYKAISKWYADKAGAQAIATIEEKQTKAQRDEALYGSFNAADIKAATDVAELFSDWKDVAAQAIKDAEKRVEDSEDGTDPLILDPMKNPLLFGKFHASKQKAALLYHFAKNPDVMRELLETKDPVEQIEFLKELEGEVKVLYRKKEEKKAPTAAEVDAGLQRPSETVSVRSGTAVEDVPPMTLADGKTLNPAWKAYRNMQDGRRR